MVGTVVDLFAGCGGFALGLERADFRSVFVSELHRAALGSYLANQPDGRLAHSGMVVQDIKQLTKRPEELAAVVSRLHREHGEIDLLVGGPPCQGYSGIGHRRTFQVTRHEIPSNHLYRDMAAFIGALGPRAFVFENVRGLETARWTPDGEQGEIWIAVKNAFGEVVVRRGRQRLTYELHPVRVYAKHFGVPQNRPRVLIIGFRSDIGSPDLARGDLERALVEQYGSRPPNPVDVLSDLIEGWCPGGATDRYPASATTEAQREFRRTRSGVLMPKGSPLTEQVFSRHAETTIMRFAEIQRHGRVPPELQTRKFAQRALPAVWDDRGPTITVTSLPDDFVHYLEPRTLTVREWARLQTFPDWFQFCGPRTTGGRRRAGDPGIGNWDRDVPRYTQIGNAVPVRLGHAIGRFIADSLNL